MRKMLFRTAITSVIIFAAYGSFLIGFGHFSRYSPAEVCVVLGSKVNEDGTVSRRLKARLDKSIELYNKNYFRKIIVSGGLGKEGFKEAEVMKLYLRSKGIDNSAIIVDNNGNNTLMTAKFTADYMSNNNIQSVLAISQYFHLFRIQLLLKKCGIKNIKCASPQYYELRDFYSVSREMVAVLKYLFF